MQTKYSLNLSVGTHVGMLIDYSVFQEHSTQSLLKRYESADFSLSRQLHTPLKIALQSQRFQTWLGDEYFLEVENLSTPDPREIGTSYESWYDLASVLKPSELYSIITKWEISSERKRNGGMIIWNEQLKNPEQLRSPKQKEALLRGGMDIMWLQVSPLEEYQHSRLNPNACGKATYWIRLEQTHYEERFSQTGLHGLVLSFQERLLLHGML